jgi:hypothetical protein
LIVLADNTVNVCTLYITIGFQNLRLDRMRPCMDIESVRNLMVHIARSGDALEMCLID